MKKVLDVIWKFINSKIFGYILIGVLVLLFVGTCGRASNLKEEGKIKDQNISALADTVRTVKLKNGDLQSSRDAFMADAKELRFLNVGLSDEVKLQSGKVVTLNRIVFQLKQDTAELREFIRNMPDPNPPIQEDDSTWKVSWALNYVYDSINYDLFEGNTRVRLKGPYVLGDISVSHLGSEMTKRNSQIGLTWGQKYEGSGKNKRLKVYAQTAHPAFQTKLLDGTYVDFPKKRHWFTGLGIGPQLGVGYDFLNNQPAITIGVGIQYNIYQW